MRPAALPLLLGPLLACRPLQDAAEREAVWWDADHIRTASGVSLVPVTHGLPVGYWPRIVLRMDGIDFDSRAWALSLPEA